MEVITIMPLNKTLTKVTLREAPMASKASPGPKIKFFTLGLFFLALSLSILLSTFQLNPILFVVDQLNEYNSSVESSMMENSIANIEKKPLPPLMDFLNKQLGGNKKIIKIGLVNTHQSDQHYWKALGETVLVPFERVSAKKRWADFFPEWIDEDKKIRSPKCPEIPMPSFQDYEGFDIVVSRVPCENGSTSYNGNKGIRDLFRLQVNLVVANLVARRNDREVYVVFIGGSCGGGMLEIFRCDDLVKHEGEFWIYKPNLKRLKQKVSMPLGTCQLPTPYEEQGNKKLMDYAFSKIGNPIDNPREAYVTVLHSSEAYVCGAIVLAQSIIQTNSTKDLVLLADNSISNKSRLALEDAGWKIKIIDRIKSPNAEKNAYNEYNYSKLRIWQLTEYDKVMFIDSDLVLLQNIDKFFAYPQLSAAGNDKMIFNSGIMLIEPSKCMFEYLMKTKETIFSYNGGDQGFLNEVFTWWHRFPRRLNYLKLFDINTEKPQYRPEVPESTYAIHFLGFKPWMCYKDYDCNWDLLNHHIFASDSAHRWWWRVYDAMPERLKKHCGLSKIMDERIQKRRGRAQNAKLLDKHWKIKVSDPRHTNLIV